MRNGWSSTSEKMGEEELSISEGESSVGCSRCDAKRCKRCCCSWNIYWKALVWLSVVTVYLGFGGLFFLLAERPFEQRQIADVQREREMAGQALNQSRNTFIELLLNSSNLTYEAASNLTDGVIGLASRLAEASQELPAETNPIWEYGPAVFFASTVITTIGYGTIAPVTSAGRTLFVFYALIGIPVALIFITTLGEILSSWIEAALVPVKKKLGGNKALVGRILVLLSAAVLGLILLVFFPSLIYYAIEDWTYGEAVYYSFVTLTTVGFGDFVPAQSAATRGIGTTLLGVYKICSAAWMWLGLAFIALLITEIQKLIEVGAKALHSCNCFHKKESEDLEQQELAHKDRESPGGKLGESDTGETPGEGEGETHGEEGRGKVEDQTWHPNRVIF